MWEHLCLCNQPNLHFLQFVKGCVFGVLKTFLWECFKNVLWSLLQMGNFNPCLRNGLPYQPSIIFNCTYLIKCFVWELCCVFWLAKHTFGWSKSYFWHLTSFSTANRKNTKCKKGGLIGSTLAQVSVICVQIQPWANYFDPLSVGRLKGF